MFLLATAPRESILLVLHTLNFLRKHTTKKAGDPAPSAAERFWHSNFWEDIDYLLVARAALHVGAHCTSLLYMELWQEATYECVTLPDSYEVEIESKPTKPHAKTYKKGSKPKPVLSAQGDVGQVARGLLLEIFTSIGEPDSFYGLDIAFDSIVPQLAMYVHEQNWPKALGTYDMVLQHPHSTPTNLVPPHPHSPRATSNSQLAFHEGLMTSLQHLEHYHILDFYLKGFQKQYPNSEGKSFCVYSKY